MTDVDNLQCVGRHTRMLARVAFHAETQDSFLRALEVPAFGANVSHLHQEQISVPLCRGASLFGRFWEYRIPGWGILDPTVN